MQCYAITAWALTYCITAGIFPQQIALSLHVCNWFEQKIATKRAIELNNEPNRVVMFYSDVSLESLEFYATVLLGLYRQCTKFHISGSITRLHVTCVLVFSLSSLPPLLRSGVETQECKTWKSHSLWWRMFCSQCGQLARISLQEHFSKLACHAGT